MAKPELDHGQEKADVWSARELAMAARELRQEYPTQPANLIVAAVHTAAHIICPSSGRVRFVQIAREVLREN